MAVLTADDNNETLNGTNGADTLTATASNNLLNGLKGDDRLISQGPNTTMNAGAGADTLEGGFGDHFYGAGGEDLAFLDWSGQPSLTANLSALGTKNPLNLAGGTKLTGIENLFLSLGGQSDRVTTSSTADIAVYGGGGGDFLTGLKRGDTLAGGSGSDKLDGGKGNDVLYGHTPSTLLGFDVPGSLADDGNGHDVLEGGDGNDTLVGSRGDDLIDGGAGIDTVSYAGITGGGLVIDLTKRFIADGLAGADSIRNVEGVIATDGDDQLLGNDLDNIFEGGLGVDWLAGRAGADTLTGGGQRDTFVFERLSDSTVAAADLITDLTNGDKIDLFGIDADIIEEDNQKFVLVDDFTGLAGQARLTYDAGADVTWLELDVDGDAIADGLIGIAGDRDDFSNFRL